MSVPCLWISDDVICSGLAHSMTTDKQEVMGLLLGHYTAEYHAVVTRALVLTRKDKKRDRVEVGYENLSIASSIAEELSHIDGHQTNVIGWYHSHPHITIFPSHVDCRTQGLYQSLDSKFVGLIFSVFDDNSNALNICGFQSKNAGTEENPNWVRIEVPVQVVTSKFSDLDPLRSSVFEHLLLTVMAQLNEERESLDRSLCNCADFSKPSYSKCLEYSRKACVYQSSMLRLIDEQLKPLKDAMESRRLSLAQEKADLLRQLQLDETDAHDVDDSAAVCGGETECFRPFEESLNTLSGVCKAFVNRRDDVDLLSETLMIDEVTVIDGEFPISSNDLMSTGRLRFVPSFSGTLWRIEISADAVRHSWPLKEITAPDDATLRCKLTVHDNSSSTVELKVKRQIGNFTSLTLLAVLINNPPW